MSTNYELDQLIAAAIDSDRANLHVMVPAVVKSYDASTRTVTAQPVVKRPVETLDGTVVHEDFPPIQNVPVVFPGGASLSLYFALAAGDAVVLVFADYSFAGWRSTGKPQGAGDAHPHGPSYPVALPWYRPNGGAGAESDESIGKPSGLRVHFGETAVSVGTGSDFVAMAQKVTAQLSALQGILSALATALGGNPAIETAAAAAGAALTAAMGTWPLAAGVASTNLKAD